MQPPPQVINNDKEPQSSEHFNVNDSIDLPIIKQVPSMIHNVVPDAGIKQPVRSTKKANPKKAFVAESKYTTHISEFSGKTLTSLEEIDIHLIYSNDGIENNGIHYGKLEEIKNHIETFITQNYNPSKIPCPNISCQLPIASSLVCEHFRTYCTNYAHEHP
jgi:hypothetical protein